MAKAWGHSRSGIEGLRPHLISAQAGGIVSSPSSASSSMPQWRSAAASACESSAQAGGAVITKRSKIHSPTSTDCFFLVFYSVDKE